MGEHRNRECLFCREWLGNSFERPVNLAFMDHLGASPPCRDAHQAYVANMAKDFKGD